MLRGDVARRRSVGSPRRIAPGRQRGADAYRVSTSSASTGQSATTTSFARFLWIFATLGIIVVVVVIGFLIGIVRALESIDNGLYTASSSVTGVEADVRPLPDYIQTINSALADIDTALKPIPGQVADVNGSLQSIGGSARNTDGSLKNTSQSLSDTSGSLGNTSGALGNAAQSLGNTAAGEQLQRNPHILRITQAVRGIIESLPK